MDKQQPLFEAKGITKEFMLPHEQVVHVLKDINLSLNPNEIVAVIGPSGCGKSTLMRIVAGIIPPTQGEILYHGKHLQGIMPNMSMIFQSFALYPWLTVQENVGIVLKAENLSTDEIEKKTKEAISLIGLEGFEDAYPREISGGMKQRVGIARALVKNPEILFMDEPFSSIDAFTAKTLRAEVVKIWLEKKFKLSSILLVSHDVAEVAYMADRIIVLSINPAEVYAVIENKIPRPRDYRSQEFLKLVGELHDIYGRLEVPKKEKVQGAKKEFKRLYPIYRDQVIGLLEYIQRRGGSYDIFKIGDEIRQHYDHFIGILETAEALGFLSLKYHTVSITEKGLDYLKASSNKRITIWKEQLLAIPIFSKVVDLLKKAPRHTLEQRELIKIISQEMPHQDPHEQFKLLARLGHYGGLFTYHKTTKHLTLKS